MTMWNGWNNGSLFQDPNKATKLRTPGNAPTLQLDFSSPYRLDSSRVDHWLARKLYYNTDQRYKLGAGFARPAIDVPTGFMGIPRLLADDPTTESQEWLNRSIQFWAGDIIKAHKMALRDGEVLIRLRPANRAPAYENLFGPDDKDLELALVPTEAFEVIYKDEDLDAIEAIKVKHVFFQPTDFGSEQLVLFETVTANEITLKYENDERPIRIMPNPLGFVPAVHLENEPEINQLHASSDLEPVEPYLKFYNDVMLHAGAASALHSTAKLILRAQDLERFLTNNFSEAEIDDGRLRFKNKDVLFFESGTPEPIGSGGSSIFAEGAEIIQAEAPLGDTTTLLEFIFLNIVDVTEIPEWAFGGAIASSKASVTEQSAPLVHKVTRKRTMVENAWGLVGRMMLKVVLSVNERVTVDWDTLAMRDLKTEAEAFRNYTEALLALNEGQAVSKISINNILAELNALILPFDVDDSKIEADRISAEVEEKIQRAQELMGQQGLFEDDEEEEDDDRQAGLRAVE